MISQVTTPHPHHPSPNNNSTFTIHLLAGNILLQEQMS